MAIHRNINVEFLNQNSQRHFPLAEDASRRDVSGTFQLPNDFLVGLRLGIHYGMHVDPANFLIKTVSVFSTGYSIVIGYGTGSSPVSVASILIPRSVHERNNVYRLGGLNDFVDVSGWVVIGQLGNIDAQPPGQWSFDIDGGRLEVDAVSPYIRGVSSLRARNGPDLSDRIYGDVILRAGRNMRITPVVVAGEDPVFVFDAIDGEGLNEDCVCTGEDTGEPIYTINGIQPTADGDFSIVGSSCLEVRPTDNGIQFADVCSEPCCGCEELETITQALEQFGRQATTLENFLVSLDARVTAMDQSVLASKLGDRGCYACDD